jgi:hypothetical protein
VSQHIVFGSQKRQSSGHGETKNVESNNFNR